MVSFKEKRMAIEMLLLKEDMAKCNVRLREMATKQMQSLRPTPMRGGSSDERVATGPGPRLPV